MIHVSIKSAKHPLSYSVLLQYAVITVLSPFQSIALQKSLLLGGVVFHNLLKDKIKPHFSVSSLFLEVHSNYVGIQINWMVN